jgi:hypothetical protein
MNARSVGLMLGFGLVSACVLVGVLSAQAPPQVSIPDSLYRRAQRLVDEGDGARGRALVDSLLRSTRDGTAERANALFWRATLAADTPSAQRDYILITVDYAVTPRAADALLRLAQIDLTVGNRPGARQRLERLVLEHPTAPVATEAWFFLGIVRRDENDLPGGCAALDSARARLAAGDVERRNRVEFESQRCRSVTARSVSPPPDTAKPPPVAGPQWSAQVAAYRTQAEGERLASTLRSRGYDARVVLLEPYYRVRIGTFATQREAAALVNRLRQERIDAIVVEAERREP